MKKANDYQLLVTLYITMERLRRSGNEELPRNSINSLLCTLRQIIRLKSLRRWVHKKQHKTNVPSDLLL